MQNIIINFVSINHQIAEVRCEIKYEHISIDGKKGVNEIEMYHIVNHIVNVKIMTHYIYIELYAAEVHTT